MTHTIKAICPECSIEHSIDFTFYYLEDGDIKTEKVICNCGCKFENTIIAYVDYEVSNPVVIKSGIESTQLAIEDDPNQCKLF